LLLACEIHFFCLGSATFSTKFLPPAPTKKPLTHLEILDLKYFLEIIPILRIEPSRPNIVEDKTPLDLTLFTNLHTLILRRCKPSLLKNIDDLSKKLEKVTVKQSLSSLSELLGPKPSDEINSDRWKRLRILNCSHNQIVSLDESLFHLSAVQQINLSHNLIERIENLQFCYSLELLDLSYNKISSLENAVETLGNLKVLILRSNKIASTAGLEKLLGLEELDLSDNNVKSLQEVKRLRKMPLLSKLWLTGNPVTFLPTYRKQTLLYFYKNLDRFALDGSMVTTAEAIWVKRQMTQVLSSKTSQSIVFEAQDVPTTSKVNNDNDNVTSESEGRSKSQTYATKKKKKRIVHFEDSPQTLSHSRRIKEQKTQPSSVPSLDPEIEKYREKIKNMREGYGSRWFSVLDEFQNESVQGPKTSAMTEAIRSEKELTISSKEEKETESNTLSLSNVILAMNADQMSTQLSLGTIEVKTPDDSAATAISSTSSPLLSNEEVPSTVVGSTSITTPTGLASASSSSAAPEHSQPTQAQPTMSLSQVRSSVQTTPSESTSSIPVLEARKNAIADTVPFQSAQGTQAEATSLSSTVTTMSTSNEVMQTNSQTTAVVAASGEVKQQNNSALASQQTQVQPTSTVTNTLLSNSQNETQQPTSNQTTVFLKPKTLSTVSSDETTPSPSVGKESDNKHQSKLNTEVDTLHQILVNSTQFCVDTFNSLKREWEPRILVVTEQFLIECDTELATTVLKLPLKTLISIKEIHNAISQERPTLRLEFGTLDSEHSHTTICIYRMDNAEEAANLQSLLVKSANPQTMHGVKCLRCNATYPGRLINECPKCQSKFMAPLEAKQRSREETSTRSILNIFSRKKQSNSMTPNTLSFVVGPVDVQENPNEQVASRIVNASFNEASPLKIVAEEEESRSPEVIGSDLSQQLYFRLTFFVSPSEEFISAISTGFLPYGTTPTKEQRIVCLLSSDNLYVLQKKTGLLSGLKGGQPSYQLIVRHALTEIRYVVVGLLFQYFRIEIEPNKAYTFVTRDHSQTHAFIDQMTSIAQKNNLKFVITNQNRETLRNLEQALQTEKLRLELAICIFQKTQGGGVAPKTFDLPSRLGNVQPRTFFMTKELLILTDEDYGSWPSLVIENKRATSEQFQRIEKHLINEIDHLELNNAEHPNYFVISFGENNVISETWHLVTSSKEQKEKCVHLIQKFWYEQFEVPLSVKDNTPKL